MLPILALTLIFGGQAPATQPALRVVVIEGEDAVNIIQQKTAVRPVIEVRDRNNLPVSGALVTFSIEGGKAATFGGASTLTVATNAAGQAAVTSLTPSAAGAFQIQVSAAFQGQVATATIAQTNVVTAAQAAAASAAGAGGSGSAGSAGGGGAGGSGASGAAGGAAGGAGGGISATTVAIAGAAVAGGTLAATQIADKVGEQIYTGTFSGTISGTSTVTGGATAQTCTFTYTINNAQARLKFEEFSDSAVRGKFDYEGPSTLTSNTCNTGQTSFIPTFIGQVDVTGSPSNFSGRTVLTPPNATGEHSYAFQGSANDNSASGTFTYQQTVTTSSGLGSTMTVASGSFPISFTKQ